MRWWPLFVTPVLALILVIVLAVQPALGATGTVTKPEYKKVKIGMCRWKVNKITKATGDIVSIIFLPGVTSELRKYHGPSKGSVVYLGQTKKGKACWRLASKNAIW